MQAAFHQSQREEAACDPSGALVTDGKKVKSVTHDSSQDHPTNRIAGPTRLSTCHNVPSLLVLAPARRKGSAPRFSAELAIAREASEQGGGTNRLAAQHAKGKLSARERIDVLLDEGSFVEIDRFVTSRSLAEGEAPIYGDGVVAGHGRIEGRIVYVFNR